MNKKTSLGSIICLLAALFYVYDYFVQVAPSVMVKDLMASFHINATDLGVLSAAFYYSYTLMQIPAGWMLDRVGARKLLTASVLVSAIGVMIFSQAHALWLAGVGRFFVGLGSAFAFISAIYLIANWFSHKHFSMLAGFVQLGACAGSIIGLAPVAALVNRYGWRSAMWITGLVTLGLALVYWCVIRDNNSQSSHSALQPFKQSLSLLKRPQLWVVAFCGLVSWVPVVTIGALWGVPYLQAVYHVSNTEAGQYAAVFWVGLGVGSPLMGWLSQRMPSKKLAFSSCFVLAIVASLGLLLAPDVSLTMSLVYLFLLGFSSASQSLSFGLLRDWVPLAQFGFASGFNNMAAILGGAISQPLFGWIMSLVWAHHYSHGLPYYTVNNYQTAMLIVPVMAFLGFGVSLFQSAKMSPKLVHTA